MARKVSVEGEDIPAFVLLEVLFRIDQVGG